MIQRQRTRLLTLLLSTVLLAGQFAALVHATEHPFHVSSSYCISLSALERASHSLLSHAPQVNAVFLAFAVVGPTAVICITTTHNRYQARAPPLS
jgi:hypothetical protein